MFRALVWLQWKSSRAWVLAAAVVVVALPVVSVVREWPTAPYAMAQFLGRLEVWSFFYPAVAAAVGIAMASLAWGADRAGHFIYALTLPIERWRHVGYRYGAGVCWILAVTGLLWVAALSVVAVTPVPPSLQSYPHGLAAKFGLATIAVFTIGFALLSLPDRSRRALGTVVAGLVVVQVVATLAGWEANWLVAVFEALVGPTGPLGMLAGRWMLIDV